MRAFPCVSCEKLSINMIQTVIPRTGPPIKYSVCPSCYLKHSSLEYYAGTSPTVKVNYDVRVEDACRLIGSEIFECGGVLAGSWALKIIGDYKWRPDDVDVFFHNLNDYAVAREHQLCGNADAELSLTYVGHKPVYTRFDMDIVMCSISKDGIMMDQRCEEVIMKNKPIEIILDNVIKAEGTNARIKKYEDRGFTFDRESVAAFRQRWGNRIQTA